VLKLLRKGGGFSPSLGTFGLPDPSGRKRIGGGDWGGIPARTRISLSRIGKAERRGSLKKKHQRRRKRGDESGREGLGRAAVSGGGIGENHIGEDFTENVSDERIAATRARAEHGKKKKKTRVEKKAQRDKELK